MAPLKNVNNNGSGDGGARTVNKSHRARVGAYGGRPSMAPLKNSPNFTGILVGGLLKPPILIMAVVGSPEVFAAADFWSASAPSAPPDKAVGAGGMCDTGERTSATNACCAAADLLDATG